MRGAHDRNRIDAVLEQEHAALAKRNRMAGCSPGIGSHDAPHGGVRHRFEWLSPKCRYYIEFLVLKKTCLSRSTAPSIQKFEEVDPSGAAHPVACGERPAPPGPTGARG